MLKINEKFSEDSDSEWILKRHINNVLFDMMAFEAEMMSGKPFLETGMNDEGFLDNVYYYFPHFLPDGDSADIFLALSGLIADERELELKDVSLFLKGGKTWKEDLYRYCLYQVIDDDEDLALSTQDTGIRRIQENERKLLLEKIKEGRLCEDALLRAEDIHSYKKILFENVDFLKIDDYTKKEWENFTG